VKKKPGELKKRTLDESRKKMQGGLRKRSVQDKKLLGSKKRSDKQERRKNKNASVKSRKRLPAKKRKLVVRKKNA